MSTLPSLLRCFVAAGNKPDALLRVVNCAGIDPSFFYGPIFLSFPLCRLHLAAVDPLARACSPPALGAI
jgi:hypothetical protein